MGPSQNCCSLFQLGPSDWYLCLSAGPFQLEVYCITSRSFPGPKIEKDARKEFKASKPCANIQSVSDSPFLQFSDL